MVPSGVSNTSVQSSQIGTDCTTGQKVTSWLNLIFCNEFATIISFLRLSRRVSYRYESVYFGIIILVLGFIVFKKLRSKWSWCSWDKMM